MKLVETLYFDDEDGKYIASKYFINGDQVDEEDYEEFLNGLDFEDDEEEICGCDECCADCEYNETGECDCPECTIEKYIERILELGGSDMCVGCLREALTDFMYDIVDHIVIEDIDD